MSTRTIKVVAGVGIAAALALGGAAWAIGSSGDDADESATGPGADRARAAALAYLGGGTANSVERDSEDGATWEVEVTKRSGETVDVRLDADFRVVVVEGDSEEADSSDAEGVGASAGRLPAAAGGEYDPTIRPADFVRTVDNRYLPLRPGTTFRYRGRTDEGVERVEVVVTRMTKRILGVTCVVVRDTVTLDGKPAERTLDWYAQDKRGNVWYFGEDSRDFERGKWVVSAGSWQAGIDGAKPGIAMPARPRPGRAYRQEYYRGHAEDMAEVVDTAEAVSVPYGRFEHVLVTREWTRLEPGVVEKKYYAPGVGEIRSETVRGGSGRTSLVSVLHR